MKSFPLFRESLDRWAVYAAARITPKRLGQQRRRVRGCNRCTETFAAAGYKSSHGTEGASRD